MKWLLPLLLFVAVAYGARVQLVRSQRRPIAGEAEQTGRFIQSYNRFQEGVRPFERYRFRPTQADIERIGRLRAGQDVTVRVLCLRVEFLEDTTPLTTGNGKMDTLGFYPAGYESMPLFNDPPHFKRYFERQMEGVRNYFRSQSLGRLNVEYTVMPEDEKSCYQLPREMQFYGDTASYFAIELGLVRLMRDAFRVADLDPAIDFSRYDEFIIFHAGSGLQADFGLRRDSPFDLLAGEIPAGAIEAYLGEPYILVDSGRVRIEQATVLPEMMRQDTMFGDQTNVLGMTGLAGTLCHEFAHLLGAYDLYDVTGVTMGVGSWSLMGYGGWLGDYGAGVPPGSIPGFLDAFHRYWLGWISPLVVRVPRESVPVFAAAMDTMNFAGWDDTLRPTIVKIPITTSEYFLIENRQVDVRQPDTIDIDMEDGVMISVTYGEYDFFQPGSGILIWHVDERIIADYGPYNAVNIDPGHKGVDLEEGDGVQDYDVPYWRSRAPDYEIYGYKFDPFFKGGYNDKFTARTAPNSDGYTGKSLLAVTLLGYADSADRLKDTVIPVRIEWELGRTGFPIAAAGAPFLSAHAADMDGDNRLELVTLDTLGVLRIWRDTGTVFRSINTGGPTRMAPAVGDVIGDSRPEVVVAQNSGRVVVIRNDGGPVVTMNAADHVFAAPVLSDLDGDGKKEILLGAGDGRLYAWDGQGNVLAGFPVDIGAEIRAPVAVTDTTRPQIVVLTGDSRLYLVGADGSLASGFPLTLGTAPYYATAQPIVGDFDRDGSPEIAVVAPGSNRLRLVVTDLAGNVEYASSELVPSGFSGATASADMNGDGRPDVLAAGMNRLFAFNPNGTLVSNYPFEQDSTFVTTELAGNWIISYETYFQYTSAPAIADIDGDGRNDIVIGSPQYGVLGFSGTNGRSLDLFPLLTTSSVSAVPLLADLDGNGTAELAVGSDLGVFYVWNLPARADRIVWSGIYHDPCHTGLLCDNELPSLPTPTAAMVSSFYVWPNPAGAEARVRYRLGPGQSVVRVRLFDMAAEPVGLEYQGPAVPELDNELVLDATRYAPGMYVVRLQVENGGRTEVKFTKLAIVR